MSAVVQTHESLIAGLTGDDPVSFVESLKPRVHTYSSTSMYLTCERKWLLRYVLGLTPRRMSKPLIVGTLFHKSMELVLNWYRGAYRTIGGAEGAQSIDSTDDLILELVTLSDSWADEIAESSDMLGPDAAEMIEYCRVQALAMSIAWVKHHLGQNGALTKWEVVAVEMEVEMPFRPHHKFGGKVDAVLRHRVSKKLYIMEHKTRSKSRPIDFGTLTLDPQANWYMEAVEAKIGEQVHGFVYDVTMKPQHRMNAKGSDDLQSRMETAMLDDPDKYFIFADMIADRGDRRRNLKNMLRVAGRMIDTVPTHTVCNTSQCDQFGGCSYRGACQTGLDSENLASYAKIVRLFDIKPPNTELAEATDD